MQAKRPVEYDRRLKPMTDLMAESYGFPSLESHMSVVIMGHYFMSYNTLLLLPVAFIIMLAVGFSRLYSRARFPHQIVGSWITGFCGLLLSKHCCEKMSFHM